MTKQLTPCKRLNSGAGALSRGLPMVMASALAFASIGGCALAGPYNSGDRAGSQRAEIGQICQGVIGLQPGEEHYGVCVESLSDSMQNVDHSRSLGQARAGCMNEGLQPNTPELAECVLKSADARAGEGMASAREPRTSRVSDMNQSGSVKSYFYTSPSDVHRREELACARLGLDPVSGGFGSCVAGLQAALFAADNPMN